MFWKWRAAALNMMKLRKHYIDVRKSESISVHRTFFYRALPMLYKQIPEAEEFYGPYRKFLVDFACRPDSSSDYEKGMGWHYYSATNSFGMKMKKSGGYYKNGVHKFHKSARTMMEEDYTMALTMNRAGFTDKGMEYLARAVHMLADMCCLPHGGGMTYYSPKKKIHQSYEDLARAMYADAIPEQDITNEQLHLFDDRSTFEKVLNSIVEAEIGEPKLLLTDPVSAITHRLQVAELTVCALLYRYYCDLKKTPEESHYLADGMKVSLTSKAQPYTVKISEDGISFLHEDKPFEVQVNGAVCTVFRAAHRHDGLFTFSPADDKKGRVLSSESSELYRFSPHKKHIFFKL